MNQNDTLVNPPLFSHKKCGVPELNDVSLKVRKKNRMAPHDDAAYLDGRADEAVRQTGSLFALVNDAVIAKTLDGKVTLWNPGAERMFGYSGAEILGRSTKVLMPVDVLP